MSKSRIELIRSQLNRWNVGGIMITNLTNCRWVSGFTGSAGTVVITADKALLGTDFRYWEQATSQAPAFELVKMGRTAEFAKQEDMVRMAGVNRMGYEASNLTVSAYSALKKNCAEIENLKLVPLNNPIEPHRHIKSAAELEKIKAAAAITDLAMAMVNDLAKPGMTERALAWELEKTMRENGADGMAFEIIVASGPNSAMAHHHPSDRKLQIGDPIIVDMGAVLDGYHSDMTRSFFLGNEPDDKFKYVYDLVHMAQKNALAHMKPGMPGNEIDALARDVISDAGQAENFGHSLGHGVGLNIHEGPNLSSMYEGEIPAGAVVSVEPGVYLSGWGGVRIEDLVIMTDSGIEFISHCPKTPIIPV
ncbi:MAG: aminopeptidase P family protein [Anaerolineae bacterium]